MEESQSPDDFVIKVEKDSIPCNRDILSKQSDYFRALLSSQMTECEDNSVLLKDVSYETILALVNCMTTGHLVLSDDTLLDVVQAAVRFQIPAAIESCESYMLMKLDDTNGFSFFQTAKSLCLEKVYGQAKRHILYYFTTLILGEDFLALDLPDIIMYLADKHLNCEKESNVLEAINYWIYHDYDSRIGQLGELLKCFHGEDLLPSEWEHVESHPIMKDSEPGKTWLEENAANKMSVIPRHKKKNDKDDAVKTEEEPVVIEKKDKYRQLPLMFLTVGGLDGEGKMCTGIYRFDDERQEFSPYHSLTAVYNKMIKHFRITSIGKDLYLTGGQCDIGRSETFNQDVWKFDAFTEKWSVVTKLPSPRRHHAACASNTNLYLLSGFGKFRQKLDSFQEYDTIQDIWHDLPSLPSMCPYSQAAYCSGKVFLHTGSCIYSYDFKTATWTDIAETKLRGDARRFTRTFDYYTPCVFDRYIYYFPLCNTDSVTTFDHLELEMEVFDNMPVRRNVVGRLDTENDEFEVFHAPSDRIRFGNNVVCVGVCFFMLNYNSKNLLNWSVYKDEDIRKLGAGKGVGHRSTLVALVKYPHYCLKNKT